MIIPSSFANIEFLIHVIREVFNFEAFVLVKKSMILYSKVSLMIPCKFSVFGLIHELHYKTHYRHNFVLFDLVENKIKPTVLSKVLNTFKTFIILIGF